MKLRKHVKIFQKHFFAKERCTSLVNKKPDNPNKHNENTVSSFLSGQQKLCCVYCQGEHFPTKCDTVTDVNACKKVLKNSLLCYLCLKTAHLRKKCTKKYICQICSKKHHISICEKMNKQSPDQTESVKEKLKLQTLRKETMIFQVFGQNHNKVKEVEIVQIKIKNNNGLCIYIEAISCPKICLPIGNQKYQFTENNYDHLRNINF